MRGSTRKVAEGRKSATSDQGDGGKRKRANSPRKEEKWGPKAGREKWMDEDGHINAEDLDSPSEDEESDGDGGFFER